MTTRAQWHLDMAPDDTDPFGTVTYQLGVEINLRDTEEGLVRTMEGLIATERHLQRSGLQCHRREDGQNCLTCKHSVMDTDEHMNRLCRLGKDMESVWEAFTAKNDARLGDVREMVREHVAPALDQMAVTEEYAELATAVGL